MSYFSFRMHQIQFRFGLHPRHRLESLQRLPGPLGKRMEGKEIEEGEREEKSRGRQRKGQRMGRAERGKGKGKGREERGLERGKFFALFPACASVPVFRVIKIKQNALPFVNKLHLIYRIIRVFSINVRQISRTTASLQNYNKQNGNVNNLMCS